MPLPLVGICVLLALVFSVFYVYRKYHCHRFFNRLNIPGPEPHWFYGNMLDIWSEKRHEVLSKWSKQFGPFFGYYEGATPIMVFSSIEAVEQICIKQFSNFQGHRVNPVQPNPSKECNHPLSHMLFAQGETWKRLRVTVNPAFSSGKLKSYAPSMAKSQHDLMELFQAEAKKGNSFDIVEAFRYLTLDIISEVGFGLDFGVIKNRGKGNIVSEKLKQFLDYTTRRQPAIDFMNVIPEIVPLIKPLVYLQMKFLLGVFGPIGMLLELVEQVVKKRKNDSSFKRNDLLQLMIDAHEDSVDPTRQSLLPTNDGDAHFSDRLAFKSLTVTEIKAQAFLFFFAAYDTTSSTLGFASFLLAIHPSIQKKLFSEIKSAFPENNTDASLDYDTVLGLEYLDCVCRETIRLFPIAVNFVNRFVINDTVVCGVPVSKKLGCVQIDVWSIHRDPELWGPVDPTQFYPERFLPENSSSRPDIAFLGFGYGPRLCIGSRLALLELKLTLTNLLLRFRIEQPDEGFPNSGLHVSSREGLLTAVDGVKVKLVSR